MLDTGEKLPAFSLPNQDGVVRTDADFRGKWLVLYVYPKDDTPGCTIQGRSFTATKADFDALHAVVVGLSADSVGSHKAFCEKFGFTIELLADPEERLLRALGVAQNEWKGMQFWERSTFLVDPHGVLRRMWLKVDPNGHEQVILSEIRSRQS
ncbi:MAG: peroxiredoxin [Deltaproteobacteria bacterium]|nr:peroxiredoxin [Deltaproteobacteria bacterium]